MLLDNANMINSIGLFNSKLEQNTINRHKLVEETRNSKQLKNNIFEAAVIFEQINS
jgi:hypothetical protein